MSSLCLLLLVTHTLGENALGIEAVDEPRVMDTIRCLYPVVKSFLDEMCDI